MALVMEDANRNVRFLHPVVGEHSIGEVSYVNSSQSKFNNNQGSGYSRKYQNVSRPNPNRSGWSREQKLSCFRCGKEHDYKSCPYTNYSCNTCKKVGHLAKMCRLWEPKGKINFCEDEDDTSHRESNDYDLYNIAYAEDRPKSKSYSTELKVNGVPVRLTIDTGAVVSVMADNVFCDVFRQSRPTLVKSSINLKTYTGHKIKVLGEFQATVEANNNVLQLPMVVIKSETPNQPTLMGRNWLERVKLDWRKICQENTLDSQDINAVNGKNVPISTRIEEIKKKFSTVFENELGTIKNVKVDLVLKENSIPVFCKARNVPFALKDALDKEINNLVDSGVIYPVSQSDWASPIVVVPKGNNEVRVCCDLKNTINPCLRSDHYPIPTAEQIFSSIAGAKVFTKLDLVAAYNQISVNESSQELLTINTSKGLFRYRRLPFGVMSAGSIFQSVLEKILSGLRNVFCYLDDILIVAKSHEEMQKSVELVLSKFQEFGVRVNNAKSEFFKTSLIFLGHKLDLQGIHPSEELTEAIVKAPRPSNVAQLRSYLGLINYYGKFIPNLSTYLHPLYGLLNHGLKWHWSVECEEAFDKSKKLLLNSTVLMPFDPNLEIVVAADASPYGVGAVLSHRLDNGAERPIAFASRTLTSCEAKYSQIEKEALALIFAIKKFHIFLYGRKFLLATDHSPLTFLLGARKAIPTLAAARIQRWALILSAYNYELVYRKASEMCNADGLSRLPCEGEPVPNDGDISFFSTTDELPVTYKEIGVATRCDPVLSKVLDFTLHGWPNHISDPEIKPYFSKAMELSVDHECLLWGRRIIIPGPYRREIMLLLHSEHPGESRIKNLARSYVWWPGLDGDLEDLVKQCSVCQSTRNTVQLAPLQHWSWPRHPWQRIHVDFATFQNKDFLIIIDSHSKWLEVFPMSTTTSAKTVEKLRQCFSAYGLPCTVVSDGGPQFTSKEFNDFLNSNGILHVVSPPYHPRSNGLAERSVQTTKSTFLKQMLQDESSATQRTLQHRIDSFLFCNRNTPHSTTGLTPAELFLSFKPRNHLSLLKPHLGNKIDEKYVKIESSANRLRGAARSFCEGEKVFVKSVRQERLNWFPGVIVKVISPLTYLVNVEGRTRFVHADHLRKNFCTSEKRDSLLTPTLRTTPQTPRKSPTRLIVEEQQDGVQENQQGCEDNSEQIDVESNVDHQDDTSPIVNLRCLTRERRRPTKLDL